MIFADLQFRTKGERKETDQTEIGGDKRSQGYFASSDRDSADEIQGNAVSPDTVVLLPPENRVGWGRYPLRVRTLYFLS
jgi:hypothetical protein